MYRAILHQGVKIILMGILFLGIGRILEMPVLACSWLIEEVDSVGRYTSIATDSNNKAHISYQYYGNLNYATNAWGSWGIFRIDLGSEYGDTGYYTSIAIDSNNKVHISYYDKEDRLRYATNASGSWVTRTVDSNLGLNRSFRDEPGTSIAIDSNNRVHISYPKISGSTVFIRYATNKNGYWTTETVYSYSGDIMYLYPPSIAIDSSNKVHIAFTFCDYVYDYLYYATNASGNWAISWLPPYSGYPGLFPSMAIDFNNKVHITHSEWTYGRLWYTTNANQSSSWNAYVADDVSGYIEDTSIAVNSNNKVHTSYYEKIYRDLKYGRCPNIPDGNMPDMVITYIDKPTVVYRGISFSVTDITQNFVPPCYGGTLTRSSITRYRLSSDSTITPSDPSVGYRRVPPLAGGASSTGTVIVTIPESFPTGYYYFAACADDDNEISERVESNNCRVATTFINVK